MTTQNLERHHAYTGVPGHGLQNEGAAFLPDRTRPRHQIGGPGHGLCSCGELSLELTSNYQRKNWHRQHKLEIGEGMSSPAENNRRDDQPIAAAERLQSEPG